MSDKKIPLKKLIANAEQGLVSRSACVDEIIQRIADMPIYALIDEEHREKGKDIISVLGLPWECAGYSFKDLIYVILAFKNSEIEDKQKKARHAIWILVHLFTGNCY